MKDEKEDIYYNGVDPEFVDLNIFPAGTYIVFLHGPTKDSNPWPESMPINYCYKLREASNTFDFKIVKDNNGSVINGWSRFSTIQGVDKLKLRLATHREISEYERLGGTPFDVTKLPKGEVVNDYFIF